jgi:hypothetical protein
MSSQRTDWLPGTRDGILAMAHDWISVIPGKAALWGITPEPCRNS